MIFRQSGASKMHLESVCLCLCPLEWTGYPPLMFTIQTLESPHPEPGSAFWASNSIAPTLKLVEAGRMISAPVDSLPRTLILPQNCRIDCQTYTVTIPATLPAYLRGLGQELCSQWPRLTSACHSVVCDLKGQAQFGRLGW